MDVLESLDILLYVNLVKRLIDTAGARRYDMSATAIDIDHPIGIMVFPQFFLFVQSSEYGDRWTGSEANLVVSSAIWLVCPVV